MFRDRKSIGTNHDTLSATLLAWGAAGVLLCAGNFNAAASADIPKQQEECRSCHPAQVESFELSRHGESLACGICHDDATQHLQQEQKTGNVLNPANLSIKKSNSFCLHCHDEKQKDVSERFMASPTLHDRLRCYECHKTHLTASEDVSDLGQFKADLSVDCRQCHKQEGDALPDSPHGEAGMTCSDCHQFHKPQTISRNIEEQIDTCLSCHPTQELEFKYPYAHPLREKQIKCSDCHDPHSDRYEKLLKKEDDRVCRECHADVIIEGGRHPESKGTNHPLRRVTCMDCHRAHGSNFEKVLKYDADVICTTCHN